MRHDKLQADASPVSVNQAELIRLGGPARAIALDVLRVNSLQTGAYVSHFKGRGMEFDESRPYQPGDDPRNIDWRVTARSSEAYTKLFREERERPVLIVTDLRSNMHFATQGCFKSVSATRAASLLAWAAHHRGGYEVSIGFVLVTLLVWVGSLNLSDIVVAQQGGFWNWHVFSHLPIAVIFFVSALAETNRTPFDLPEAESELVAGYQVEYSSMAFALFWLGEYTNIILMCALTSLLFFGGWHSPFPGFLETIPFTDWSAGWIWFFWKIFAFFFLFGWVKATLPRYRYDQLMRLGWKVFLPISLFLVVFYAGLALALGRV